MRAATSHAAPRPVARSAQAALAVLLLGAVGHGAAGPAAANPLPRQVALTSADVSKVVRQVVAEARARDEAATVAVVDRVGNVLATYVMNGAGGNVTIDPEREVSGRAGLANVQVPALAAAIAKAVTGAYLSSNGNAFSSRTASQIVQENFNPGSRGLEGGPLFGVQFSSLPCSDLTFRFASNAGGAISATAGPKRSPLGLSADPGGFPLYKNGVLVGGVGATADGQYGLDRDIRNRDDDLDELLGIAGTNGFGAPSDIRADRLAVDGRTLRYADRDTGDLETDEGDAAGVNLGSAGSFRAVRGYSTAGARAGQAFGFGASGFRPAPGGQFGPRNAFILTSAGGGNRFAPRAGSGSGALSANEVRVLLSEALGVAFQARAQIRRPLGSHVEVTVSVVDGAGRILGVARTPDAPVFGTDVSLQKARSAMFFSNAAAASDLGRAPAPPSSLGYAPRLYIGDLDGFFGSSVLGGRVAFSNRSIGNIARPFFPDGQNGERNGPLSLTFSDWSPFHTGLQLDLVLPNLLRHVGFVTGGGSDTAPRCANIPRLANGLQIFPGGVPLYRGNTLVGGIGVSGDGIDQDDMVAFLGADRAGKALRTGVGNAPSSRRSDRLDPDGVNLRYVQCPFRPFLSSDRTNVCEDL